MKTEFIQKWSNWWMFNKNKKQLDVAFERELNEIIKYKLDKSKAPEMLEFLIEMVESCDGNDYSLYRDKAEQLIKEATEL